MRVLLPLIRPLLHYSRLSAAATQTAGGGLDVHGTADPVTQFDRPGDGQSHRHLAEFSAADLPETHTNPSLVGLKRWCLPMAVIGLIFIEDC
jgi:hypothetical protein